MLKKLKKIVKALKESSKEEVKPEVDSRTSDVASMEKYLTELFPEGDFYTLTVMIRKENFNALMEILNGANLDMGIMPNMADILDTEQDDFDLNELVDSMGKKKDNGDKGPLQ